MNEQLFYFLNSFAGKYPWLDTAIVFSAETLGIIVLIGVVVFLLSHEHRKLGMHNIIVILLAAGAAWGATQVIKYAYPSPRPFVALSDVTQLIQHGNMDSFPSGHAAFFAALATVMFFYHKKLSAFLALLAVVIGMARVAAGVHWPVDILAGFIVGVGVAAFVYYAYRDIVLKRFRKR